MLYKPVIKVRGEKFKRNKFTNVPCELCNKRHPCNSGVNILFRPEKNKNILAYGTLKPFCKFIDNNCFIYVNEEEESI